VQLKIAVTKKTCAYEAAKHSAVCLSAGIEKANSSKSLGLLLMIIERTVSGRFCRCSKAGKIQCIDEASVK
jgi:hypothetical protein